VCVSSAGLGRLFSPLCQSRGGATELQRYRATPSASPDWSGAERGAVKYALHIGRTDESFDDVMDEVIAPPPAAIIEPRMGGWVRSMDQYMK